MKKNKLLCIFVFILYVSFLIGILFFGGRHTSEVTLSDYIHTSVNLTPFKTILNYYNGFILHKSYSQIAFTNLIANLLIFFPMGFFVPVFIKKINFFQYTTLMFIILLFVELTQLILRLGIFDIDDIILNLSGAILGYIIYKIIKGVYEYGRK